MKDDAVNSWSERITALGNAFATAHKQLRKLSADPFEVVGCFNSVRQVLQDVGIDHNKALDALLPALESECIRLQAEFWGLLTQACGSRGWEVVGSTNRRMIKKAVFVSLEGNSVKMEGAPGPCTPFVPSFMPMLARVLEEAEASEPELKTFLGVLAKAYDVLPRSGSECSLEAVYRHCLLESQKPNFWRAPSPTSFVVLSRPAFRYRISEILRLGLVTSDSRAVALGTTTMSKDSWEIYSPGEQRVVIAGRFSLTRMGGDSGH